MHPSQEFPHRLRETVPEGSPATEAGAYLKLDSQPHTALPELPGLPLTIHFVLYKRNLFTGVFLVGWLVWGAFSWGYFGGF